MNEQPTNPTQPQLQQPAPITPPAPQQPAPTVTPQQPLPPGMTPPDPGDKTSARKRLVILIPALLILLAIGIVLGAKFFSGSSPDPKVSRSDQPKFENLLTPTSEIKVGDFRYVSTCQAFPMSTAEIFAKSDSKTYVVEEGLAVSRPLTKDYTENRVRTSCGYSIGGKSVYLRLDQFADPADAKDINSIYLRKSEDQALIISILKKLVSNSGNADATELVATFEKSLERFKPYEDKYKEDIPASADFNGMILPAYSGGYIDMVYGNVVYSLDSGIRLQDASVDDLAKLNKAFKAILAKAKEKSLDQSPANTILGNKDTIGNTKILEPCLLLSRGNFKALTGVEDNDLIERITLPVDANGDRIDKNGNRILARNSCERNYEGGDIDKQMDLEIYYGKSVEQARQFVKDYSNDPKSPPSPLQTTADEAYVLPSPVKPSYTQYLFRVGSYVAVVDFETITSNGGNLTFTNASQQEFVNAINTLTDTIKKQQ